MSTNNDDLDDLTIDGEDVTGGTDSKSMLTAPTSKTDAMKSYDTTTSKTTTTSTKKTYKKTSPYTK